MGWRVVSQNKNKSLQQGRTWLESWCGRLHRCSSTVYGAQHVVAVSSPPAQTRHCRVAVARETSADPLAHVFSASRHLRTRSSKNNDDDDDNWNRFIYSYRYRSKTLNTGVGVRPYLRAGTLAGQRLRRRLQIAARSHLQSMLVKRRKSEHANHAQDKTKAGTGGHARNTPTHPALRLSEHGNRAPVTHPKNDKFLVVRCPRAKEQQPPLHLKKKMYRLLAPVFLVVGTRYLRQPFPLPTRRIVDASWHTTTSRLHSSRKQPASYRTENLNLLNAVYYTRGNCC